MRLRDYQEKAIKGVRKAWKKSKATLGVAATGLGKTVIFAELAQHEPGRVLILAHRAELIHQAFNACDRLRRSVGIEMAHHTTLPAGLFDDRPEVVVATFQTLIAGRNGGRVEEFNPHEFSLVIIDEAHRSMAKSYRRLIDYFSQNDECKFLGVTATPDRGDKQALGEVYGKVAFDFDIRFGIDYGWLVPIRQYICDVSSIRLDECKTRRTPDGERDFVQSDLAKQFEAEKPVHEVCEPLAKLTEDGQRTIVFAAGVDQAKLTCRILRDYRPTAGVEVIHGKLPDWERASILRAYRKGHVQYLINVDIALEGFDDPRIAVVAIARPTKSRTVFAQMIGRGTRALPGVVDFDDLLTSNPGTRKDAIADSSKTHLTVIDFTSNTTRHSLIHTTDILAGRKTKAEVVAHANRIARRNGGRDVDAVIEEATEEYFRLEREREEAEEAARAKVLGVADFRVWETNPFSACERARRSSKEVRWNQGKKPNPKDVKLLEAEGLNCDYVTFWEAREQADAFRKRMPLQPGRRWVLLNKMGLTWQDIDGWTEYDGASFMRNEWRRGGRRRVADHTVRPKVNVPQEATGGRYDLDVPF